VRRWLLLLAAGLLAGAGYWMAGHPYGDRAALGLWPVPQGTPWEYQLWSGVLPALTVVTLVGSAASLYRVHNCHASRCWRLGKHKVDGTPWCNLHHEDAREQASATLNDVVERLDALIGILGARRRV
jgi:hypothetical protein